MQHLVLLSQRCGVWSPKLDATLHAVDATNNTQPTSSSCSVRARAVDSATRTLYLVTDAQQLIAYSLDDANIRFVAQLTSTATRQKLEHGVEEEKDAEKISQEEATEQGEEPEEEEAIASISSSDVLVSFAYLSEQEALHLVTRSGTLCLFLLSSSSLSLIGSFDDGVLAACWSPDHELLALVTGGHALVLMSSDGQMLAEHQLVENGSGVISGQTMPRYLDDEQRDVHAEHRAGATLVWRGDSQFFALSLFESTHRFRRLRVFTREGVESSKSFPFPAPALSSAADLSSLSSCNDSFEKQHAAEASELLALGLTSCLAWRPSGSLLASTHRRQVGKSHTHEIVFFERNGLRHGEFSLAEYELNMAAAAANNSAQAAVATSPPATTSFFTGRESDVNVLHLCWNADSDVLAALVQDIAPPHHQSIELYTCSNYHWARKHTINFHSAASASSEPLSSSSAASRLSFLWHPESSLTLLVLSENDGVCHSFNFCYDYAVDEHGEQRWAAVMEGSLLKVTPLALAIVPPPLSWVSIALAANWQPRLSIHASTFPLLEPSASAVAPPTPLLALDSDNMLYLIHDLNPLKRAFVPLPLSSQPHVQISLKSLVMRSSNVPASPAVHSCSSLQLRHLQCRVRYGEQQQSLIYDIVTVVARLHGDQLLHFRVQCGLGEGKSQAPSLQLLHRCSMPAHRTILRLYQRAGDAALYVQSVDGSVFCYQFASACASLPASSEASHENADSAESASLQLLSAFPSPCPWFGACEMGGVFTLIGRDRRSRLYANAHLLTPQCSSFSLSHPQFFAFTIAGVRHALFLLDTRHSLDYALTSEARADPHAVRQIEKGGELIVLVAAIRSPRAVLQMPRGNLETVYPRALTLASLVRALRARQYGVAFETARVNRVDLNVLVDFDREQFLRDAASVIEQIGQVDRINLLLSALVEHDLLAQEFPHYQRHLDVEAHANVEAATRESEADASQRDEQHSLAFGLASSSGERRNAFVQQRKAREAAALEFEERLSRQKKKDAAPAGKVNAVCAALREAIEARSRVDGVDRVLCVLTSLVRQRPPRLEEALTLVKRMRDEKTGDAEAALKYCIFLVDVSSLYAVALGLYDRGLALLVARQSQQDPKEYVPLLASLFAHEAQGRPQLARFAIDTYLRRFDRALVALIRAVESGEAAGDERWPEVMQLAADKRLWTLAIESCGPVLHDRVIPQAAASSEGARRHWGAPRYDLREASDRRLALLAAYAAHLRVERRSLEASALYLQCGEFDKALRCYQEAGQWRLALALMYQLAFDNDAIRAIAFEFVALFKASGSSRHARDASRLLLELGEDVQEACAILCASDEWEEALYVCQSQGRPELLALFIVPQAEAQAHKALLSLAKRADKYLQAVRRLRLIRRVKLMMGEDRALHEDDAGQGGDEVDDDLQSIVSGVSGSRHFSSSSRSESGDSSSGMSGVSASSRASTASVFSLAPSDLPESDLTPLEQKRLNKQARKSEGIRRRINKKRVKEGSLDEDVGLIDILREARLHPDQEETLQCTVRFLLSQGIVQLGTALRSAVRDMMALQSEQESTAMPQMEGMNEAQREALARYWKWPQCLERVPKEAKHHDDDHFYLRFVAPLPEASIAGTSSSSSSSAASAALSNGHSRLMSSDDALQDESIGSSLFDDA